MRQQLQKYTGIFCMLSLLLIMAMDSHAQSVTVLKQSLNGTKIVANDTISVTDNTYFDPARQPKLDTPYSVKNVVTLKINEYSPLYLPAEFTASVNVRIIYTKPDFSIDSITQTLALNYKSTDVYTGRSSFVFNNAHKVKVRVLGVNITSATDILPALILENEMYVHPVYKLACTDAVQTVSDNAAQLVDTSDELTVQWTAVEGADDYDFEWTYIDSTALYRYGSPTDIPAVFRNNATRVTVTGTTYTIPLIFDEPGYIFYRVRSVQERANNVRMETVWSSTFSTGLGKVYYKGHERTLNWQSATSFAEEGKRKVVVNYFDGSLHSRQTVTKDNSTNTAIVAETMYDYQGRPAIQVMPAPTLSNAVKYFRNFNNASNGDEYDKNQYDSITSARDYLTGGAAKMSALSGANQYYSVNNPERNQGMNRYLPDADGYAFTQTEYTQDNTGRISRQSGVGSVYKLGSNHETMYMYGTPSQDELDLLFGTDVGDKSHYFKNSVEDPNGQISISYVDMHGRTIATALAGGADSANLSALPGVTALTYSDTLSRPGSNVIKDLSLETTQSQLVPIAADYNFHYKINTPSVQIPDCSTGTMVNYPVWYDLEITITDDMNNQRFDNGQPIVKVFHNYTPGTDPAANAAVQNIDASFTVNLKRGNYQITKRLVVNSDALAYYRDNVYMAKALCKNLNDFINEQRLLQTNECVPTCQACFAKIGSWENFRTNYMNLGRIQDTAASRGAAQTAYEEAIDACNALCDSVSQTTDVLKQMLQDLTPPSGQYAVVADTNNIYSIFYNDADVEGTIPPYQDPSLVYLDENGKPDIVYDETTGAWVTPQNLAPDQFANKFKPSWAKALLKYHPEYCKYLTYVQYKVSYDWDDKVSKVDTYQGALSAGYLNPLGDATYSNFTIVSANRDPIVNYTTITNTLKSKMANYESTWHNMYTMAAIRVKCPGTDTSCYNTYKTPALAFSTSLSCTADLDMEWRTFREMYLTAKHNEIDAIINAASCTGMKKVTSSDLINAGYQPIFNTASAALGQQGPSYLNRTLGGDSVRAAMDSSYARNCRSYIADWLSKLSPCNFSTQAINEMIPKLVEVCKQGADDAHPFGSSTVAPNSTYQYKSFQQVLDETIRKYSIVDAYKCNAYLVTAPAPYDQQPPYYDITLTSKPEACQCTKISLLNREYQANKNSTDTDFATYLNRTRGIKMTQANLTLLLNACSSNSTNCISLASPVTIPPALQCYTGDICVTCTTVDTMYDAYISKYPGYAPVRETTDSVQLLKNQLFENYMNVRLGFSKHYWEYMDFMAQCVGVVSRMAGSNTSNVSNVSNPDTVSNVSVSTPARPDTNHLTCHIIQDVFGPWYTAHPESQGNTLTVTKKVPLKAVTHLFDNGSYANSSIGSLAAATGHNSGGDYLLRDNAVFNLGVIASDAVISNATMSLYAKDPQYEIYTGMPGYAHRNASAAYIYGYFERALGAVKVGATNWSNQPATTTANRLSIGPFPLGYSSSSFLNQPCTGLLNDMVAAYKNSQDYGLIFKLSDETKGTIKDIIFWGKTDTTIADPAFITVTYTASRCEEFTAYVNEYLGTSYNTAQVNHLFDSLCGSPPNVCTYPSYDGPLLCGKSNTIFKTLPDTINNCSDSAFLVFSNGYELYNAYKDSLKNRFDKIYRDTAIAGGQREIFTVDYATSEYQYTLYYYDQAGNLTRTVPPAGVVISRSAAWKAGLAAARKAGTRFVPSHTMATEYRYNMLNAIVSKKTPDDSITNFWYDKLGRLVVSQNGKQALTNSYSYTNYDPLGRIIEVGEISSATAMTNEISRSEKNLSDWLTAAKSTKTQIVSTNYDIAYAPLKGLYLDQANLRNRVSWAAYYNTASAFDSTNYATGTFYSYDIHGNVDTLLQDYKIGNMSRYYNRFKKVVYQYDLISGKVNFVAYQPGKKDAYYHRYAYDAENRLTNVETSKDSIYWENDAYYTYYKHGALARTVIGQQQVQGIDYAYTLQGWLKGINSTALNPSFDMGGDGASGGMVAKDAFGFGIHYYGLRDYTPIGTGAKPFALAVGIRPLFNGNIAAISQSVSTLGTPLEYIYSYDVLNRLTGMTVSKGLDSLANSWTNTYTALQDFKEAITYDNNGNILTYKRNGNNTLAGAPLAMDDMSYHYRPGTNKLSYVTDLVNRTLYGNDLDNQLLDNYKYDSIGNMVSDLGAGVDSIKWNVYGKVTKIYRHNKPAITYTYDVSGNRISKTVDTTQTWYVRDIAGNVLSVYTYGDTAINKGQLSQVEAHLYGSSRLGMTTLETNVQDTLPLPATGVTGLGSGRNITFVRGKKFFELTNHLDNVLATVSDRKLGVSLNSSTIDSYQPVIVSAQEYYPFGMLMPGRGGKIGTGENIPGTLTVGGQSVPGTLTVNQRTDNQPGTYMATQVINFEDGFSSGDNDAFTTLFVDQANADPGTDNGVSYGITSKGYRYGFNGKENDNEVKGDGNEQDYGMRIYDSRVGRFLSTDPLTRSYPELTPYQFASNSPIVGVDQDGEELKVTINKVTKKGSNFEIYGSAQLHYKVLNLSKMALSKSTIEETTSIVRTNIDRTLSQNGTAEYGDAYPNGKIAKTAADIVHYTFTGKVDVTSSFEVITSADQIKKGDYVLLLVDDLRPDKSEGVLGKADLGGNVASVSAEWFMKTGGMAIVWHEVSHNLSLTHSQDEKNYMYGYANGGRKTSPDQNIFGALELTNKVKQGVRFINGTIDTKSRVMEFLKENIPAGLLQDAIKRLNLAPAKVTPAVPKPATNTPKKSNNTTINNRLN